jgi:predicted RecA/RadA family phage recombinase
MAQATYIQVGREIDYTPGSAVVAGQVVVQANLVGIAKTAIAANTLGALSVSGIFDVDQAAEAITAGSPVYWDADGNSVSGTAGAGAATATASGNTFMGFAQATTEATDSYVRIALRSAETVAGGVATATSITGTASTLPIAGLAAAQGGAVSVTAGAGVPEAGPGSVPAPATAPRRSRCAIKTAGSAP